MACVDALSSRPIAPADAGVLAAFFAENDRPAIVERFDPFALTDESASRIALHAGGDRHYLCYRRDRPVGFWMLRGWSEGYAVPAFGLLVDHREHGKGIGAWILRAAVAECRRLDCARMLITTYADNQVIIAMHTAIGFREVSRTEVRAGGRDRTKLRLELDLGLAGIDPQR